MKAKHIKFNCKIVKFSTQNQGCKNLFYLLFIPPRIVVELYYYNR